MLNSHSPLRVRNRITLGHLLSPVVFLPTQAGEALPSGNEGRGAGSFIRFRHRAAQGWKQLILLKQQQRQNYTQCQSQTTVPGMPNLLLLWQCWPHWVEDVANVSPRTSIHLETAKSIANHPNGWAAWFINPMQMHPDQAFLTQLYIHCMSDFNNSHIPKGTAKFGTVPAAGQ